MSAILTSLAASGLGYVWQFVKDKGADAASEYIKEKTGLDIDLSSGELKEEEVRALKEMELNNEKELKAMLYDYKKAELKYNEASEIEDTKKIASVNQTMQVEANSTNKWASMWRPFWGFISAIAFLLCVIGIVAAMVYAASSGNGQLLGHIPMIVGALTALFAIPGAILGVTAWHRGKMQRVEAGESGLEIDQMITLMERIKK